MAEDQDKVNAEGNATPPPQDNPPKNGPGGDTFSGDATKIVGGNVKLHQGTQNIVILQGGYGSSTSVEDLLGKLGGDDNSFSHAYKNFFKSTSSDTPLTNENTDTHKAEEKLPETPEEIEDWYCDELTEWETCFVEATAVLHGAPLHEIRNAAQTLYHPSVFDADKPSAAKSGTRISENTLRTRLYMQKAYIGDAERLLWCDANASGLSSFASRLLPIIVSQSNLSVVQEGTTFLEQLEEWTTTLSGECAWRANRALGSIWLKLDKKRFQRMINEYVESDDFDDWRRAATLLDGAYEVEYAEHGEQIEQENNSLVLTTLARWTQHAHASFQINVASTAAQAYGRIGQTSTECALKGLETLLRYPLRRKNDSEVQMPLLAFVSVTSSYFTLARFGYIRAVLQHIAAVVEKCCYHRRSPSDSTRKEYRAQCRFLLDTMFHVFFVIASLSLNGVKDKKQGNYTRETTLPTYPILPDAQGQDSLLAGILSNAEADWRQHIMTILCGAILEENAEPAFFLLKVWAETMLKEVGPQQPLLREAFSDFLLELWDRGNQWCILLASVDEYADRELFTSWFEHALQQWQVKKGPPQPVEAFAKDVLKKLDRRLSGL